MGRAGRSDRHVLAVDCMGGAVMELLGKWLYRMACMLSREVSLMETRRDRERLDMIADNGRLRMALMVIKEESPDWYAVHLADHELSRETYVIKRIKEGIRS